MAQMLSMLERSKTPFWLVDVVALGGVISFVWGNKLEVSYGLMVMMAILGFGQAHRALGAQQAQPPTALPPPPPPTSPGGMSSGASGVVTALLSIGALVRNAWS